MIFFQFHVRTWKGREPLVVILEEGAGDDTYHLGVIAGSRWCFDGCGQTVLRTIAHTFRRLPRDLDAPVDDEEIPF